jgi:hypothetical protein
MVGTAEVKHIDSKLFVTVKDKYNKVLSSSDYKSFRISKTGNSSINDEEISFLYSQTNNSYWNFNDKEIFKILPDTYTPMNFIGSSSAIYITAKGNGYWLFDNGDQINNTANEGIKTYRTSSGTYSQFQILRNTETNKRYFIPKEIFEDGLYYTAYPIFSK